jgi:beta-glucanase (GH16 family)
MVAVIGDGPPPTRYRPPRPRRSWRSRPALLFAVVVLAFSALVYVHVSGHHKGSGTTTSTGSEAWRQVFFDDFTGSHLDRTKWTAYGGRPSGQGAGLWSSAHDVVGNGQLTIRGYREPAMGNALVTGGLSSAKAIVQTYGKYLVRMRMDAGRGVSWVAMLWPADNHWPPEVDFGEDNGAGDRHLVYATQHYSTPTRRDTQVQVATTVDMTAWHTIGVEWSPSTLRYTLDGAAWATTSNSHVPSQPMVLDLQTQAWGCLSNRWEQCADRSTPAEVDLHVDWVAAYARSG